MAGLRATGVYLTSPVLLRFVVPRQPIGLGSPEFWTSAWRPQVAAGTIGSRVSNSLSPELKSQLIPNSTLPVPESGRPRSRGIHVSAVSEGEQQRMGVPFPLEQQKMSVQVHLSNHRQARTLARQVIEMSPRNSHC